MQLFIYATPSLPHPFLIRLIPSPGDILMWQYSTAALLLLQYACSSYTYTQRSQNNRTFPLPTKVGSFAISKIKAGYHVQKRSRGLFVLRWSHALTLIRSHSGLPETIAPPTLPFTKLSF